ncbi:hypothetical protein ASF55_18825 [Methylobacterium sp. Leaf119]|nr:hypothetical protein ASF55_18825 [Methylobacterium sp. Leaf119]
MMFYGEHAQNELSFCHNFIEPGAVVLDVGAHQGTHTVSFSNSVGATGRVFAFEPQRLMYQNLCASLALNSIENVSAFNVAVGGAPGKVKIAEFDYSKRAHFSGMRILPENSGEEVPLITLDYAVPKEFAERVGLIKIDVEGMEMDVLEGAECIVSNTSPVIYCEYHKEVAGRASKDVVPFLKQKGYSLFLHEPAGYNPENFFGYAGDRFMGGKDHNIVCIHESIIEKFASAVTSLEEV